MRIPKLVDILLATEKKTERKNEKNCIRKPWKFFTKNSWGKKDKKLRAYQYSKDSSEKSQQQPHQ